MSASTITVRLDHAMLMLGLQGQQLGLVKQARLDAESGELLGLVLETRWQHVELPWRDVEFDGNDAVFRLSRPCGGDH
ncbi:hypothetical protein E4634_01220 [Mangrovimicrobium sediminis]|uniref:DUF2171 domain-containing protein n=1 Tax=Mangrovimicrobium sediminis TaxID=2562682 RepID=A0A4Z0MA66_9GAMM|nr:hypothetical protein [Haliea sp. SAOS-164]TGD76195.1 hypothetical protein E4634_01220 [Haliea sp. SAOS-164]